MPTDAEIEAAATAMFKVYQRNQHASYKAIAREALDAAEAVRRSAIGYEMSAKDMIEQIGKIFEAHDRRQAKGPGAS